MDNWNNVAEKHIKTKLYQLCVFRLKISLSLYLASKNVNKPKMKNRINFHHGTIKRTQTAYYWTNELVYKVNTVLSSRAHADGLIKGLGQIHQCPFSCSLEYTEESKYKQHPYENKTAIMAYTALYYVCDFLS